MEFDITNLDKVALLQALYAYSEPAGHGRLTHAIMEYRGDQVEGLELVEARSMLENPKSESDYYVEIADYHQGKPIKFGYRIKPSGQHVASSLRYDSRNMKYRFFEAMLNTFSFDEIIITQKTYPSDIDYFDKKELQRPSFQEKIVKKLVSTSIRGKNEFGTCWTLPDNAETIFSFFYEEM